MVKRRRVYERGELDETVRPTQRDIQVLELIHAFDGMMSLKQIWRRFFPGRSESAPRNRLKLLCDAGYLTMPVNHDQLRWVPPGEIVYWLDTEGAKLLAGREGVEYKDFHWQRSGRWSKIAHDLLVNDFRLCVMEACEADQELSLREWVPESDFLINKDTITYKTAQGHTANRIMQPDGFFLIQKPSKRYPGKWANYAFILEIDNSSESNVRFGRDKVPSGVAYLESDLYAQRFGIEYGRFVVAAVSRERVLNIKEQTERFGGGDLFYFTTFGHLSAHNVLTSPMWWRSGSLDRWTLIPPTD
jgi:hypothetical protein